MRINCELAVAASMQASGASTHQKPLRAILALGDGSNAQTIQLLVSTSKNKHGAKYQVINNIEKVFDKFVDEGKATIQLKQPPQLMYISKVNVVQLKGFLKVLTAVSNGQAPGHPKMPEALLPLSKTLIAPKSEDLKRPMVKLQISSRAEYPFSAGFPAQLQELIVHDCKLERFDSRILKLVGLRTLDFSGNCLTKQLDLLAQLGNALPQLQSLSLAANDLTDQLVADHLWSGLPAGLTILNLARNQLTRIPDAACAKLRNLRALNVAQNRLRTLPILFYHLQRLQELDISRNALRVLPACLARRSLSMLDISNNQWLRWNVAEERERLTRKCLQLSQQRLPLLQELAGKRILDNKYKMVRESRHLKLTNVPDITEEKLRLYFCEKFGRVQRVEVLKHEKGSAMVSFMDLPTAARAYAGSLELDGHVMKTVYSDPPSFVGSAPAVIKIHETAESYESLGCPSKRPRLAAQGEPCVDKEALASTAKDQSTGSSKRHERLHHAKGEHAAEYAADGRGTATNSRPSHPRTAVAHGRTPGSRHDAWTANGPTAPASPLSNRSSSRSRSASASGSSRESRPATSGARTTGDPYVSEREPGPSSSRRSANRGDKDQPAPAILIKNLPLRSTDQSIKDGLFHKYKKLGKVVSVKVVGDSGERYAVVTFRRYSDVEAILHSSQDELFFGSQIHVELAPVTLDCADDNEKRPLVKDFDEFHPNASRTLYIGNLENRGLSTEMLRELFMEFGDILDIDIKNANTPAPFAFVQFADIVSVVKAIHKKDGDYMGSNKLKLGFGKSIGTHVVWLDEVPEVVTESSLYRKMNFYGNVSDVVVDRCSKQALVFFDTKEVAAAAVTDMKGRKLGDRRVQIDFASRELQDLFLDRMDRTAYANSSKGAATADFSILRDLGGPASLDLVEPYYSIDPRLDSLYDSTRNLKGSKRSVSRDGRQSSARAPVEDRPRLSFAEEFVEGNYSTGLGNVCGRTNDKGRELASPSSRMRSMSPDERRRTVQGRGNHQRNRDGSRDGRTSAASSTFSRERDVVSRSLKPKQQAAHDDRAYPMHLSRSRSPRHSKQTAPSNVSYPDSNVIAHRMSRTIRRASRQQEGAGPRTPRSRSGNSSSSSSSYRSRSSASGSASSSDRKPKDTKKASRKVGNTASKSIIDAVETDSSQPAVSKWSPTKQQQHASVGGSIPDLLKQKQQLLQMLEQLDHEEGDGGGKQLQKLVNAKQQHLPRKKYAGLDETVAPPSTPITPTSAALPSYPVNAHSPSSHSAALKSAVGNSIGGGPFPAQTVNTATSLSATSPSDPRLISRRLSGGSAMAPMLTSASSSTTLNPTPAVIHGAAAAITKNLISRVSNGAQMVTTQRRSVDIFAEGDDTDGTALDRGVSLETKSRRRTPHVKTLEGMTNTSSCELDEAALMSPLAVDAASSASASAVDSGYLESVDLSFRDKDAAGGKEHSLTVSDAVGSSPDSAREIGLRKERSSSESSTPAHAHKISRALTVKEIRLEALPGAQLLDPRRPTNVKQVDFPLPNFRCGARTADALKRGVDLSVDTKISVARRPSLASPSVSSFDASASLPRDASFHRHLSSDTDLSPDQHLSASFSEFATTDTFASPRPNSLSVLSSPNMRPTSPAGIRPSLEERIKALDKKFVVLEEAVKAVKGTELMPKSSVVVATTPSGSCATTPNSVDYTKFTIKKKVSSSSPPPTSNCFFSGSAASIAASILPTFGNTSLVMPPNAVKTPSLLRSTIFDQDSERLKSIEEKYTPGIYQPPLILESNDEESVENTSPQKIPLSSKSVVVPLSVSIPSNDVGFASVSVEQSRTFSETPVRSTPGISHATGLFPSPVDTELSTQRSNNSTLKPGLAAVKVESNSPTDPISPTLPLHSILKKPKSEVSSVVTPAIEPITPCTPTPVDPRLARRDSLSLKPQTPVALSTEQSGTPSLPQKASPWSNVSSLPAKTLPSIQKDVKSLGRQHSLTTPQGTPKEKTFGIKHIQRPAGHRMSADAGPTLTPTSATNKSLDRYKDIKSKELEELFGASVGKERVQTLPRIKKKEKVIVPERVTSSDTVDKRKLEGPKESLKKSKPTTSQAPSSQDLKPEGKSKEREKSEQKQQQQQQQQQHGTKKSKHARQIARKPRQRSCSESDSSGSDSDSDVDERHKAKSAMSKEWLEVLACLEDEPVSGLSMYDRVKQRSSAHRTDDTWKEHEKKSKFTLLKQTRADKHHPTRKRVHMSSSESGSGSEREADGRPAESGSESEGAAPARVSGGPREERKSDVMRVEDVYSSSGGEESGSESETTAKNDSADKGNAKLAAKSKSGQKTPKDAEKASKTTKPQKRRGRPPKVARENEEKSLAAAGEQKKKEKSEKSSNEDKPKKRGRKPKQSTGESERRRKDEEKEKTATVRNTDSASVATKAAKKASSEASTQDARSSSGTAAAPKLVTKAAMKQVSLPQSPSPEKRKTPSAEKHKRKLEDKDGVAERSETKGMKRDTPHGTITTVDNAIVSAEIVHALKRTILEESMDERADNLNSTLSMTCDDTSPVANVVEVTCAEVVVSDADLTGFDGAENPLRATPSPEQPVELIHTDGPSVSYTTGASALKQKAELGVIDTPAAAVVAAVAADTHIAGLAQHHDHGPTGVTHVDEVIDNVVHGYVEIDAAVLIKMNAAKKKQMSPTERFNHTSDQLSMPASQDTREERHARGTGQHTAPAAVFAPVTSTSAPWSSSSVAPCASLRPQGVATTVVHTTSVASASALDVTALSSSVAAASSSFVPAQTPPVVAHSALPATASSFQHVASLYAPATMATHSFAASATSTQHTLDTHTRALLEIQKQGGSVWSSNLSTPSFLGTSVPPTTHLTTPTAYSAGIEQHYSLSRFADRPPQETAASNTFKFLVQKYPIVWQGQLALKNDTALVQMHYVSGNLRLAQLSLPAPSTVTSGGTTPTAAQPAVLRIAQRMRLEPQQLEGVSQRMQRSPDHCTLLALPCGLDQRDIYHQSSLLSQSFITYLQQKQAAGIVNVAHTQAGSQQPLYVIHIFPPCEFAQQGLAIADDFHRSVEERRTPYLFVVVTTVN